MNKKALIGTIIWAVILFLVISATIFYFALSSKDSNVDKQEVAKPNKTGDNYSINEYELRNSNGSQTNQQYNPLS